MLNLYQSITDIGGNRIKRSQYYLFNINR